MKKKEQNLLTENLSATPMGLSLPFIHKNPAPMKSSWFDRSRGQLVELYGTKASQGSEDVEVFLNIVDTMIGTLYKYDVPVSLETFHRMVEDARTKGVDSLFFPKLWSIVKP